MKVRVLFFVAIIALTLCSCTQQQELPPAIDEPSSQTTTEITEQIVTLPDSLPSPETILLVQSPEYEWADGEDIEYIYRFIYYTVPHQIFILVEYDGFGGENFTTFEPEPEMALVSFIKHYKIEKDDFVEAVQREYEWALDSGCSIYNEDCELPNADIIYTFDNEVINAYYRRENPVVPDEYRTYESYEEYLRANR